MDSDLYLLHAFGSCGNRRRLKLFGLLMTIWDHLIDVAEETGVPTEWITGTNGTKPVIAARREVMWRSYQDGHSYSEIGRFIKRDRTTVMHGVRKADEARQRLRD